MRFRRPAIENHSALSKLIRDNRGLKFGRKSPFADYVILSHTYNKAVSVRNDAEIFEHDRYWRTSVGVGGAAAELDQKPKDARQNAVGCKTKSRPVNFKNREYRILPMNPVSIASKREIPSDWWLEGLKP